MNPTPGVANVRNFDLVKRADGAPIITGTVNLYVVALTGANAGKWFRGSDSSWQAAEAIAVAGTLTADGHWYGTVVAACWTAGIYYQEYARESTDLHISVSRAVRCEVPQDIQAILGTALTETVGGYIAAGFKKFFNVDIPAADVKNGIIASSLAAQAKTDVAAQTDQEIALQLYRTSRAWFVLATGNDANDGLSWATAKLTLAGVTGAVGYGSDQAILIGPGTFNCAVLGVGVTFANYSGMQIHGAGPLRTILTSTLTYGIYMGSGCWIDNLGVTHAGSSGIERFGIIGFNSSGHRLTHLNLIDTYCCFEIGGTSGGQDANPFSVVEDVSCASGGGGTYAIQLKANVRVRGLKINVSGVSTVVGLFIESNYSGPTPYDIYLEDVSVEAIATGVSGNAYAVSAGAERILAVNCKFTASLTNGSNASGEAYAFSGAGPDTLNGCTLKTTAITHNAAHERDIYAINNRVYLIGCDYDPAKVTCLGTGTVLRAAREDTLDLFNNLDVAVSTRATDAAAAAAVRDVALAGEGLPVAGSLGAAITFIASVLSGITSLKDWLRGLFRKDAMNAAAKGEVNAAHDGGAAGTFDEATDSAEALADAVAEVPTDEENADAANEVLADEHGDGSWLTDADAGAGAYTITVIVTADEEPLEGARVRLTSGVLSWTGLSDADGLIIFNLDAATYTVAATKAGYSYGGGTCVVDGDAPLAVEMTAVVVPLPPDPAKQVMCIGVTRDAQGEAEGGVVLTFRLLTPTSAGQHSREPITVTSGEDSTYTVPLLREAAYEFSRAAGPTAFLKFTTPDEDTYELPVI